MSAEKISAGEVRHRFDFLSDSAARRVHTDDHPPRMSDREHAISDIAFLLQQLREHIRAVQPVGRQLRHLI